MKICIDGLSVSSLQGTGLCSHSCNFLSKLFEMYPDPEYELVWNEKSAFPPWRKYQNITFTPLKINRINNDYRLLEQHLAKTGTQIYHSPNNGLSIPRNKVCRYVITVHDLSPLSCSEFADENYYRKFKSVFPGAIEKADQIIAVSNFIKEELIKYYRIPEQKIEVIYPWCPEIFQLIDFKTSRQVLKERYRIEGKFVLYAGSLHARKNLDVLLKTLKQLLKETEDINLVIVGKCDGKRDAFYSSLTGMISELGLLNHVVFTGVVPYEDMPYFYSCAECTVNLSYYDGFPMTAVEAIACNSPLICLPGSSFKEVAGDAAIFVENPDSNKIKDLILSIIAGNNAKIRLRNDYHCNSIKKYSVHATKKLIGIYESMA